MSSAIREAVEAEITVTEGSKLQALFDLADATPHVIKYVAARWAANYQTNRPLKISDTPALTWGTGTYVAPVAFPLTSALYGRIGLVSAVDPRGWRVFDATTPSARAAYLRWARSQATFEDLVLTVHSTFTNHVLRNKFRRDFRIDCVLFHPDQEAELHTIAARDVWMLVTDWLVDGSISGEFSKRVSQARFTVLIDEEFLLVDDGDLPVRAAQRQIEATTVRFPHSCGQPVGLARRDSSLAAKIVTHYQAGDSYVHLYVEP